MADARDGDAAARHAPASDSVLVFDLFETERGRQATASYPICVAISDQRRNGALNEITPRPGCAAPQASQVDPKRPAQPARRKTQPAAPPAPRDA
jgi:hypothetical protein